MILASLRDQAIKLPTLVVEEINDIGDHKQITCKMHLPLPVVQQQRKDKRPLIQRLSHQNTDKEKAVKSQLSYLMSLID